MSNTSTNIKSTKKTHRTGLSNNETDHINFILARTELQEAFQMEADLTFDNLEIVEIQP